MVEVVFQMALRKEDLVIALGTRAELIKMAPVMRALARKRVDYFFLHTGQHGISDLVAPLRVKKPDLSLEWAGGGGLGGAGSDGIRGRFGLETRRALLWSLRNARRIGVVLAKLRPAVVACHGDTMSTAAIAVAAKTYSRSSVLAHVEAGLRSNDLGEPFPEEFSRRLADLLSNALFAPTQGAAKNVSGALYRNKKVFVTGNTNVDVLLENLPRARKLAMPGGIPKKGFVFAQMHRQENIRSRPRASAFVKLLAEIPAPVALVLLENTAKQFDKFGLMEEIKGAKNVLVKPNLPYLSFLKVFSNAACVVTDSGGQTEEAAVLKIPTVIFRKRNERPEAEECGVAVRVGFDEKKALHFVVDALTRQEFYARAKASANPFGDGKAGERIAVELIGLLK